MALFDDIYIKELEELCKRDPERFIDTFITIMSAIDDDKLNDTSIPIENKKRVLKMMKNFLIEHEAYEKCVLLKKIEDRLSE